MPTTDKQTQQTCYVHNSGILLSLEKEGNADTCYSMDGPWGHYAEWNKPIAKGRMLDGPTYMKYLE